MEMQGWMHIASSNHYETVHYVIDAMIVSGHRVVSIRLKQAIAHFTSFVFVNLTKTTYDDNLTTREGGDSRAEHKTKGVHNMHASNVSMLHVQSLGNYNSS